ncbi:hypothetical protein [Mycobacterium sp. E3198]|uniref:hypothetical protein n=1 Tax=Mycobacterium sp. E3198 TaxID=1834143 RepID=UPI0007FBD213|nr:hypothetical protein [Mycobacterium sp. E3198]OBG35987.1 hypothetical protein A5673_18910 [Mycobacterium sp. E3198]
MNHITRTRRDAERSPGLVSMGIAALALVVCVINFVLGDAGAGVVAASVGLLAFGAGLAWLVMDGRRFRDAQRGRGTRRPAP